VAACTFRFISPVEIEPSGIPNPCTSCGADKANPWAIKDAPGLVERIAVARMQCPPNEAPLKSLINP